MFPVRCLLSSSGSSADATLHSPVRGASSAQPNFPNRVSSPQRFARMRLCMALLRLVPKMGLALTLLVAPAYGANVKTAPRVQIEKQVLAGFTNAEREKLIGYQSVTHATTFNRDGREYLSGISYQLVDMKADELFGLLQRVDHTLPRALPATHKARYVGNSGDLPLVQLIHGNAFLSGTYTVLWQPEAAAKEVRFWMAPELPHDVNDIYGFFRITPVDNGRRSLVTVAVAVDLGSGGKAAYAGTVQEIILKSARYVGKFVDRRRGKNVD